MRRLPLAIVTLVAWAAVAETAPAASTTIAPVLGQNPVRAYAGAGMDGLRHATSAGTWSCATAGGSRTAGDPARRRAADGRRRPRARRQPMLAYVGCNGTCRVVLSDLDGTNPRTVPGSEHARSVSISGSRVAWVRRRQHRARPRPALRHHEARARRAAAQVLDTVADACPRQGLVTSPPMCEATSGKSVDDIDLDGTRLALIVSYGLRARRRLPTGPRRCAWNPSRGGPQRLLALMNRRRGPADLDRAVMGQARSVLLPLVPVRMPASARARTATTRTAASSRTRPPRARYRASRWMPTRRTRSWCSACSAVAKTRPRTSPPPCSAPRGWRSHARARRSPDSEAQAQTRAPMRPRSCSTSASCTVFSAAPLRRLSPTTKKFSEHGSARSRRTRPTATSSRPA